jgi:predicted enzyme related to lactoylglutathione lyase
MNSQFFWFDLMSPDVATSKKFYAAFSGWTTQSFMDGRYEVLNTPDGGMGGLMSNKAMEPGEPDSPPMWLGYVHVTDVDASVKRAEKLGAKVKVAPRDIPTVGRFSVLADPQGAVFAVFKPTPPSGQQHNPAMSEKLGHMVWAELYTSDWQKAWGFYSELFNWKSTETMDMKEMGKYAMFSFGPSEKASMGGMLTMKNQPPAWMFYVSVKDTDAVAKQIATLGGKIINGPMDVPGGGRIAQCLDPHGITFGIWSRK